MTNSRSYNIKTEQERRKKPYFSINADAPSNGRSPMHSSNGRSPKYSSLSNYPDNYLTRALKEINHEVNYQQLSDQQIVEERASLKMRIKDMNRVLAKMVQKQMQRRYQAERVSHKAIVTRQMGMNYDQLTRQYIQNQNKIQSLEDQFQQNNDKLVLLSDPYSKMNLIKRIAELQLKLKEIKEQLGRIKKNKFLRERQIIKTSSKDKSQIQTLQINYINAVKKSQILTSKYQEVQSQLTQSQIKAIKQNDYFEQLAQDLKCQQHPSEAEQEHNAILYKTSKRKLQLTIRKTERQEQTLKKKYYNCLLDFKNIKSRIKNIQLTSNHRKRDNDIAVDKIHSLSEQLRQSKRVRTEADAFQTFMAMQMPKQKIYIKRRAQTNSIQINTPKQDYLGSDHSRQTPIKNVPRRWNTRGFGSILRQVSLSNKVLNQSAKKSEQLQKQNGSNSSGKIWYQNESNYHRSSGSKSGKIKHFKTEGEERRNQSKYSGLQSMAEESSISDLEG